MRGGNRRRAAAAPRPPPASAGAQREPEQEPDHPGPEAHLSAAVAALHIAGPVNIGVVSVASQHPQAGPAGPAAASSSGRSPVSSDHPLPGVEGKSYAVWALPGHPHLRGVHTGADRAYAGLIALFPGQVYSYSSGVRFRRFDSWQAATIGYLSEAAQHRAPALRFHHWP